MKCWEMRGYPGKMMRYIFEYFFIFLSDNRNKLRDISTWCLDSILNWIETSTFLNEAAVRTNCRS